MDDIIKADISRTRKLFIAQDIHNKKNAPSCRKTAESGSALLLRAQFFRVMLTVAEK